jgi:flagellar biosynthesis protein FlhF
MPEAVQRIREELGQNAVILNTKEIRSRKFLGLIRGKKIEVIAASEDRQPEEEKTAYSKRSGLISAASGDAAAIAVKPAAAAGASVSPALGAVFTASAEAASPVRTDPGATGLVKDDWLIGELQQMKTMIARLSQGAVRPEPYPEPIARYRARLIDQEILPELVERLLERAAEEYAALSDDRTNRTQDEDARAYFAVRNQLKHALSPAGSKGISENTRIAHFVGPTGVGKTTTIAKLAAEQVLKYNRKVGFITSDTYRIAAIEQLKTYASILNCPLEVVFSPQELPRAFRQMSDRDLILMDTAGRNFRNMMYVSELNALLRSDGPSETYLVLSLTSKYKDMREIADNFAKFSLDKVLFTKMDETSSYGSIVNLLHEFPLRASYVANGQNVPDDIMELDEEKLAELLLKEYKP